MGSMKRENEIHFVAVKAGNKMQAGIEKYGYKREVIYEFDAENNRNDSYRYNYAKLFRALAFKCLSMASEYELQGREIFPEECTKKRHKNQLVKMYTEFMFSFGDSWLNKMSNIAVIENILEDYFGLKVDFWDTYCKCEEKCCSYDKDHPDMVKCTVDKYVIYLFMYIEDGEGNVIKMIVDDSENQHIYRGEFHYQDRFSTRYCRFRYDDV